MILVTGGTGVMGSVLVRKLAQSGRGVRVLTLPGDPHCDRVSGFAKDIVFGSVTDKQSVRTALKGVSTVYHLAAIIIADDPNLYQQINYKGTRTMVEEAEAAHVRNFVHISSASVVYPKPTPYSLSKAAAENAVLRSSLNSTVIRPTLIYDTGSGGQEFDIFLSFLRGFPIIPFIGKGDGLKRPVFVGDIIDGLVKVLNRKGRGNKVYNFSGGETITMIDFTRLCLRHLGMAKKPIIHVPVNVCMILARVMEKVMRNPPLRWPVIAGITQDADLDPTEAMEDLNYNPRPVSRKLPECFPRE